MRYSQPPSPRVDRGHPLARGLTGAIIPPFAERVAAAVYAVGKAGRGFTSVSDSNYWIASQKSLASVYPQWTILVIAQGVVTAGGNTYCERPTGNQILKLGRDGASRPQLVMRNSAGAGLMFLTASTSTWCDTENANTVVITQRGTQDHKLYVNGVQEASDVTTNVPFSFNEAVTYIARDPQDSSEAMAGASVPLILTWSRALSDGEIANVSRNPWQIFASADRIWPASSSAVSYTITPSGGVVFSGAAAEIRGRVTLPTGGVTFGGTAPNIRGRVVLPTGGVTFGGTAPISQSNAFVITPSGGVAFSGTAVEIRGRVTTPTGGVSFAGAAPMIRGRVQIPTGGIVFSGTGPLVRTDVLSVSGGVVFSGIAPIIFNGGGGGGGITSYLPLLGAGK